MRSLWHKIRNSVGERAHYDEIGGADGVPLDAAQADDTDEVYRREKIELIESLLKRSRAAMAMLKEVEDEIAELGRQEQSPDRDGLIKAKTARSDQLALVVQQVNAAILKIQQEVKERNAIRLSYQGGAAGASHSH